MAFWFAPFLVGWDAVPPFKSLFFSFIASTRNWPAMLVYGFAVLVIAIIVPGALMLMASLISKAAISTLFVMLRILLVFVLAPVLSASLYLSYRDIFHRPVDTPAAAATPGTDE
jgi:membrane protein implicated in regulation of membrane protease activity